MRDNFLITLVAVCFVGVHCCCVAEDLKSLKAELQKLTKPIFFGDLLQDFAVEVLI